MKHWFSAIAASLGALGAFAAACSSNDGASPPGMPGSGQDSGSNAAPPAADGGDADGDTDASDDAPPAAPQAFVRIAHVSPDLPPIDICVAPHGTTAFQGPLVGQLAASLAGADGGAADASLPGLSYTQVSAYLPVTPGQYDVRVVAAGAVDCTASLAQFRVLDDGGAEDASSSVDATTGDAGADASALDASFADASALDAGTPDAASGGDAGGEDAGPPDAAADAGVSGIADVTNLPAIAFNTYTTLLIAGDLSPAGADSALTLTMLGDDAILAGGAAVLRAVNAVPSNPSLDFGYVSPSGAWSAVLDAVPFAKASSQAAPGFGSLDTNGYLAIAPLAGQAVSALASDAGADVASAMSVEVDIGSIATVLAVGGKTGDTTNPPALLLCIDNQPSGGLLSDCSVAQ